MFTKIEKAIDAIKDGEIIIIVDDDNEDNQGALVMAGQLVTKDKINFMIKHGSGILALAVTEDKLAALDFPAIEGKSDSSYSISVDYKSKDSGVSAEERSITIDKLLSDKYARNDFRTPGNVFLVKTVTGGVLKRASANEAAVDISAAAELKAAGVISKVLTQDGSIAKLSDLLDLAKENDLKIITIEDLIAYRREKECYVVKEAEANLPTEYGDFKMVGFVNKLNGEHHVALVKGEISTEDEVLVRVHSECLTGDAFHSLKCDCGEQLAAALSAIEKEGKGILLYLRQEGRGIGLINKIKAYKLQEEGMDTEEANLALGFPSDMRDYGIGAQILSELNVRKLKLMTNNPKKLIGLKGHGIDVVQRVPLIMETNKHNKRYFSTKKEKMGHLY